MLCGRMVSVVRYDKYAYLRNPNEKSGPPDEKSGLEMKSLGLPVWEVPVDTDFSFPAHTFHLAIQTFHSAPKIGILIITSSSRVFHDKV